MARRRRSSGRRRAPARRPVSKNHWSPVMSQQNLQQRIAGDLMRHSDDKLALYEEYKKEWMRLQKAYEDSRMSDSLIASELKEIRQLFYALQAGLVKEGFIRYGEERVQPEEGGTN